MQVLPLHLPRARKLSQHFLAALFTMLLVLVVNAQLRPADAADPTITVSGTSNGTSTQYIGANGDMNYDSSTLQDVGFNTWRIWNDITVFEPNNDTSYGSLSPDDIKSNVNVIPWKTWDTNMSQYKIYDQTKKDGVKLVISLRNTGIDHSASWMANPLRTTADNNEWWEHVFATVYWLNVRNDYHVDDFEVFNEPDNNGQGWKGTEADYLNFAQLTHDAIDYVYKTYLPNRSYHLMGPSVDYPNVGSDSSVPNGKGWLYDLLHISPTPINAVSYHHYATGGPMQDGIRYVHDLMQQTGHGDLPVWITEWGSYDQQNQSNNDDSQQFAVRTINNLIEFSQPGSDHIDGSHYYIWQDGGDKDGILDKQGNKRTVYSALKLAVRALQGGKPTYQSTTSNSDLTAITTKDSTGTINLLVTNINANTSYAVNTDISALFSGSTSSTIERYDSDNKDTQASGPAVNNGKMQFSIPASAAVLIRVANSSSSPTAASSSSPTAQGTVASPKQTSSSAASVNSTSSPTGTTGSTATIVSIDTNTKYQTIDGFGFFGAMDTWWGKPEDMYSDKWADQVFNDLGITVWRNEYYSAEAADQPQDANWDKQRPVAEGLVKKARDKGIDLKIILSVWSPPGSMKCMIAADVASTTVSLGLRGQRAEVRFAPQIHGICPMANCGHQNVCRRWA